MSGRQRAAVCFRATDRGPWPPPSSVLARKPMAAPWPPRTSTRTRRRLRGIAAVVLVACKGREASPTLDVPPSLPSKASPEEMAIDAASTIAGSVGGAPFTDIAASFVIESPDSDTTTVIYLFSKPVRCVDLSFAGWDRGLGAGGSVLELKVSGKAPGSYLSVTTPTLSAREAVAEWMRTSTKGIANEVRSSGGWITVDSLSPLGQATGTFALEFGAGQLKGSFRAAFCPGGHEP
jgi:hypothetical protein